MIYTHFPQLPSAQPMNIGDNIVVRGAQKVIIDRIDFMIGAPWIWDGCERTEKYSWLKKTVKPGMIALSVGSAHQLQDTDELFYKEETLKECEAVWKKFALVICRDKECHKFMKHIGANSVLLPCTSIFAADNIVQEPIFDEIFVTYDVDKNPDFAYVSEKIRKGMPRPNPYVTLNMDRIKYWTEDLLTDHLRLIKSFKRIISTKVHQITPFTGRELSMYPIDSRGETARLIGIPYYPEVKFVEIDKHKIRMQYIDAITSVI